MFVEIGPNDVIICILLFRGIRPLRLVYTALKRTGGSPTRDLKCYLSKGGPLKETSRISTYIYMPPPA